MYRTQGCFCKHTSILSLANSFNLCFYHICALNCGWLSVHHRTKFTPCAWFSASVADDLLLTSACCCVAHGPPSSGLPRWPSGVCTVQKGAARGAWDVWALEAPAVPHLGLVSQLPGAGRPGDRLGRSSVPHSYVPKRVGGGRAHCPWGLWLFVSWIVMSYTSRRPGVLVSISPLVLIAFHEKHHSMTLFKMI